MSGSADVICLLAQEIQDGPAATGAVQAFAKFPALKLKPGTGWHW